MCDHPAEMENIAIEIKLKGNEIPQLKVEKLDIDKLLRTGISKYTDQVGKLWNSLAKWWILRGNSIP